MPEWLHSVLWVVLALYLLRRMTRALAGRRRGVALLAALVVGATVLRFALASWGPGDLRMTTATVFEPTEDDYHDAEGFSLALSPFASAPDGLVRLAFLVAPATDRTIVVVNLLLGGLCPLFAVLFAGALGLDQVGAGVTGLLIGVMPLLVRFSGEGNRVTVLLFAALCGLWLLTEYSRRRGGAALILGTAALVLAVSCRPEAALVGPTAAMILLRPSSLRRDLWPRLFALGLVALAALGSQMDSQPWRNIALVAFPFAPDHTIWLDSGYNPPWMMAAFFLGLPLFLRRAPWAAATSVVSLALIAWTTYHVIQPSGNGNLASCRYQVLALPFVALVVGAGLSSLVHGAGRFVSARVGAPLALVLALVLLGATWPTLRSVTARRTINDEYDLFREVLPRLPTSAEIVFVAPPIDTVLTPPRYLATMFGRRDLRWATWPPEEAEGGGPRFYWRGAGCSLSLTCNGWENRGAAVIPRVRAQCAEAFARHGAHPVAVRDVPARNFAGVCYEGERIQIGLYAITPDAAPRLFVGD